MSFKTLLYQNGIEERYILQICENSDLESGILTLTGLDLPKNVLIKVSEALKSSPEIIELCLKQSLLTDETLSMLLKSLNCDLLHLKVLNLESIRLNNDILEELSTLIAQNRSIERLCMQWTNFAEHSEIAKTFFLAISKNDTIEDLSLSNSGIMSSLAKSMATLALKSNVSLRQIDLSWNKIGDAGGEAILDMLRLNKTIQKVSLTGNSISKPLEKAIESQLLHNIELHLKNSEMISKTIAMNKELHFTKDKFNEDIQKAHSDYEDLEMKAVFEIGRLEQQLKTRNEEYGAVLEKLALTQKALEIAEEKIDHMIQVDKARMKHLKDLQDECAAHEKAQQKEWNEIEEELRSKCQAAIKEANEAKIEAVKCIESQKAESTLNAELQQKNETLKSEIDLIRAKHDDIIEQLKKSHVEESQELRTKLDSLIEEHSKDLEHVKQENFKIVDMEQKEKRNLADKIEELKRKVDAIRNDHSEAINKNEERHQKFMLGLKEDYKLEIDALKDNLKSEEERNEKIHNEIQTLKHSKNELEIELTKMKQITLKELKEKIDVYEEEKSHLANIIRVEFENDVKDKEHLKIALEKSEGTCTELKAKVDELSKELESCKGSYEDRIKHLECNLSETERFLQKTRENEQNRAQLLLEAVNQYVRPASQSEDLERKCAPKKEIEIVNEVISEKVDDSKKSENCSTAAKGKMLDNESIIKEAPPKIVAMTSEDEDLIQSEMALVESELQTLV